MKKVWTFIATDFRLLKDDPEGFGDVPIRQACEDREDAVADCIFDIREYLDELEDDPATGVVVPPVPTSVADFKEVEGDLLFGGHDGLPLWRVHSIAIK